MITVTVEQKQGATTRRMKVSALSIERALEISGSGRPDTAARVVFPIDAETLGISNDTDQRERGLNLYRQRRAGPPNSK